MGKQKLKENKLSVGGKCMIEQMDYQEHTLTSQLYYKPHP